MLVWDDNKFVEWVGAPKPSLELWAGRAVFHGKVHFNNDMEVDVGKQLGVFAPSAFVSVRPAAVLGVPRPVCPTRNLPLTWEKAFGGHVVTLATMMVTCGKA